jgi:hypothetical protein
MFIGNSNQKINSELLKEFREMSLKILEFMILYI